METITGRIMEIFPLVENGNTIFAFTLMNDTGMLFRVYDCTFVAHPVPRDRVRYGRLTRGDEVTIVVSENNVPLKDVAFKVSPSADRQVKVVSLESITFNSFIETPTVASPRKR